MPLHAYAVRAEALHYPCEKLLSDRTIIDIIQTKEVLRDPPAHGIRYWSENVFHLNADATCPMLTVRSVG